jgi:hypothetical protein
LQEWRAAQRSFPPLLQTPSCKLDFADPAVCEGEIELPAAIIRIGGGEPYQDFTAGLV